MKGKNENKLFEEANDILIQQAIRDDIEKILRDMPKIAELSRGVYQNFMDEGFRHKEAWEFTKEYVLGILLGGIK